MINPDRLLDTLLSFLSIESPSRQEGAMARAVLRHLEELGLEAEVDEAGCRISGQTGNIIARLPGTADAPGIILNAHLDTVGPVEGVRPQVREGKVVSAGETILGADDKAGVAAIVEAVRVMLERSLPRPPIDMVFTIAEEIGLLGAKHLDYARVTARMGFVLDAARAVGAIIVSAPGHDAITATITGKAAHAGLNPEKGINAIKVAADAVSGMRLGRIDEETTANIGTISGGRASNIVPDRAEVVGEARSRNPEKLRRQTEHMVARFKQAADQAGAACQVNVERVYEAYTLREDEPVVRIASRALEAMGIRPRLEAHGGGSDSNIFNARGIRTAVLSTGCENAHATDEYIPVQQLEALANLVLNIASVSAAFSP